MTVNTGLGSSPQETPRMDSSHYINQSLEELSTNLLAMLCRPFGDPIDRKESKECFDIGYGTGPSRKENQCLMENLDWDFEDGASFQVGYDEARNQL